MKKIFSKIGLFGLVLFSFFYTHKTVTVLKENDDIMIKIKENLNDYNIYSINSVIKGDTIIPGIKGKIVNIDKSYENMKKIGIYNSNYLVYDIDTWNKILLYPTGYVRVIRDIDFMCVC